MYKGHWQTKASLEQESPDIIRIIGPSNNDDGWSSMDGRNYSTYELENYYVKLATSSDGKDQKTKTKNSKLFDGLDELVSNHQNNELKPKNVVETFVSHVINEQPTQIQQTPNSTLQEQVQHQQVTTIIQEKIVEKIIEVQANFDTSVIDKLNIDNMNLKNQEAFGEDKYSKPTIVLPIEILFDYDLSRIAQTIDILDLNEKEVIDYLTKKSLTKLEKYVSSSLKNYLHNLITNKIEVKSPEIEKVVEKIIEVKTPVIEVVSEQPINEQPVETVLQEIIEVKTPEIEVVKENNDEILQKGLEETRNFLKQYYE